LIGRYLCSLTKESPRFFLFPCTWCPLGPLPLRRLLAPLVLGGFCSVRYAIFTIQNPPLASHLFPGPGTPSKAFIRAPHPPCACARLGCCAMGKRKPRRSEAQKAAQQQATLVAAQKIAAKQTGGVAESQSSHESASAAPSHLLSKSPLGPPVRSKRSVALRSPAAAALASLSGPYPYERRNSARKEPPFSFPGSSEA
jgi:hypothetical protein